ncbi:hypothetical protein [Paracoccus mutanolyticus]|uniref:hypothetical protein n=1 Tax=Paracoccus mutanolyticus TaxID=1499308 RepID=UPI0011AE3A8B|nr:hypothetical protein [Paracoccus mutanolyticus]
MIAALAGLPSPSRLLAYPVIERRDTIPVELSEIGEAVAPSARRQGARLGDRSAIQAILDHHQPFTGQAPVLKALQQEARRRDEGVDLGKKGFDEQFPAACHGADLGNEPAADGRGRRGDCVPARREAALVGCRRVRFAISTEETALLPDRHLPDRGSRPARRGSTAGGMGQVAMMTAVLWASRRRLALRWRGWSCEQQDWLGPVEERQKRALNALMPDLVLTIDGTRSATAGHACPGMLRAMPSCPSNATACPSCQRWRSASSGS